jgi:hypothetical protein
MSLNGRIRELENKIIELTSKLKDLSLSVEEKTITPYSKVGGTKSIQVSNVVDIKTGLGNIQGGAMIWNDSELFTPALDQVLAEPTKGYNKHSHSSFSGGALIKGVLEIIEYDWDSVVPPIINKHSQQYWQKEPKIKKILNTKNEVVEMVGQLDLVFNVDTKTWGTAAYEIDVKKCYLVERETEGENIGQIKLDSKGQEMKSPLYNEDQTKTSIVWDENAGVFRFYAVYASGE